MTGKTFDRAELANFTGSERWFRHSLVRTVLYTEGARYVAATAEAYWLLDEIAFAQHTEKTVAAEAFQVWKLVVSDNETAVLTCEDGNDATVFTKAIEYTDFPAPGITLWYANKVIFLPSEY